MLLFVVACARGPDRFDPGFDSLDDGGAVFGDAANPSVEACEMGAIAPCQCPVGQAGGQRSCEADGTSPQYGHFGACSGCRAPEDADSPVQDAASDSGEDGGAQDAGLPDSAAVDPCEDGEQNGSETDLDCGGDCGGCPVGDGCATAADCADGASCLDSVCTLASSPDFRNYDHGGYTYARAVDWSCSGTTRFDSTGSGSWVQSTSCSNTDATRPEVTCGVAQTTAGGPEVCILRARGFVLGAGHTLELVGDKPVIVAVEGDATIAGIINASANGTTPGAGGNWSCGASQGRDGAGDGERLAGASGGGGGAFGTRGGAAGTANTDGFTGSPVAGGAGGQVRGDVGLTPLLGGCPGGRAGGCGTAGGAGGGAVQIAARGALVIQGTIEADGAAGATPCGANDEGGGTGGGAGGAILLEGGSMDVANATLRARGGDGGRNGTYAGIYNCGGSPGGAGASSPQQDGQTGQSCQGGSSGGGGGHGRVVIGP